MLTITERLARKVRKLDPFRSRRIAAEMRKNSIVGFPPNYVFKNELPANPVVMDVGCASEAEFAQWMIENYNAKSYAIDPTRKHAPALSKLSNSLGESFVFLPLAVASTDCEIEFHESTTNESGSILDQHINVANDTTESYTVRAVSLPTLLKEANEAEVHLLKLDLEGAEFDLISSLTVSDVQGLEQVFVEFHHHCSPYSLKDTESRVRKMESFGYSCFTADNHNYLFFRD